MVNKVLWHIRNLDGLAVDECKDIRYYNIGFAQTSQSDSFYEELNLHLTMYQDAIDSETFKVLCELCKDKDDKANLMIALGMITNLK